MNMPMKKGSGLNWNPASVELPEIPTIQGGQDALSSTIAAVLPTLAVPLAANVATLQAKEGMFAGKLGVAEAAYQSSDDQGGQSVGQVVGMLGQLGQQAGQMGQMAGAPAQAAGQGSGMFGSLIQQAMQAAQGAGAGQSAGGQPPASAGQGAPGGAPTGAAPGQPGAPGQAPPRDDAPQAREHESRQVEEPRYEEPETRQEEERQPLLRADDSRPSHGPVPVTPPEHPRHSGADDLGRRL
jgi:hypothetical protein